MQSESQYNLRQRLEQHLNELPSLPTVVAQLMTLDREDEQYFENLLGILESEPSLSARVLAYANSAASGASAPITTLRAALARVGSQRASNLVLSLAVTSVLVPRDEWEKSLWRHAIQVAWAARELARLCDDDDLNPDEAYVCGLLHDVGRFVMFKEAPEQLRQIDEGDWEDGDSLIQMELSICGLVHTELGAVACRQWGLPEPIPRVVEEHHKAPGVRLVDKLEKLSALIRVADLAMFPSALPGTPGCQDADDETLRDTVQVYLPPFLPLDLAELRELLQRVSRQSEALAATLGVA